MKILYCASVSSHIINFHLPYIQYLSEQGCEVTTLTADSIVIPFANNSVAIPLTKNLLSVRNIVSIFKTKNILREFDTVITNTTLAGAVVRAALLMFVKRKHYVIHICHGFLFNKNDRTKKWFYLLIERICSLVTDLFIVMNKESQLIATKYKLGKRIVFTYGMGINIERFSLRPQTHDDFVFVYVADFSRRKNQAKLIDTYLSVADFMPNSKLIFAGDGPTFDECKVLAKNDKRIKFLGHVTDVPQLLIDCDVAVSTSRYEGLPFNILEAMAAGLPVIASEIPGHIDLGVETYKEDLGDRLILAYQQGKRRIFYPKLEKYSLNEVKDNLTGFFLNKEQLNVKD